MKLNTIIKPYFKSFKWIILTLKYFITRKDLNIKEYARIVQSDLGYKVEVGENTIIYRAVIDSYSYIGANSSIANVRIGKFCSIAGEVIIGPADHPKNFISTHPTLYPQDNICEYRDVIIGNDVWIGQRVIIMGGITVGHGAIIGANAIVTKDIEPYGIYVGVPAKLIGYRFDKKIISKILASQWWEEEEEWLISNKNKMQDVERFIEIVEERRENK